MKVKVYELKNGDQLSEDVELNDNVFNVEYDNSFMSMYFTRMKSASYIPTNKTKNISEISGTTRKPFKQKHNGTARQGSTRSAQMRGGAIAFGPRGVKGFVKIPKGEAILAKSMLLSKALRDNKLFVIKDASFASHRTADAKKILSKFSSHCVVIVNDGSVNSNSLLAVRNLQGTKFVSNDMLTASDLIYADAVLIDVKSVNKLSNNFLEYENGNN